MKVININNQSTINGTGELNSAHCKPIICIDTGDVYTSVTDAANSIGCSYPHMVNHLKGKMKTCRGKHYCYLSDATENLDAIVTQLRSMQELKAKAAAWDALQAEQEAARRAEEKRLADIAKEEARRQAELAKAEAKVEKLDAAANEYYVKYLETLDRLTEAEDNLRHLRAEYGVEEEIA